MDFGESYSIENHAQLVNYYYNMLIKKGKVENLLQCYNVKHEKLGLYRNFLDSLNVDQQIYLKNILFLDIVHAGDSFMQDRIKYMEKNPWSINDMKKGGSYDDALIASKIGFDIDILNLELKVSYLS